MTTLSATPKETARPGYSDYSVSTLTSAGSYTPNFVLSFDACDASSTYVTMNQISSVQEDTWRACRISTRVMGPRM